MYTEFTKKTVFEQLTLAVASSARRCHGRQQVLIPECDLTGKRSTILSFLLGAQCSCSCVETLVMLRAKFHVVSSLLSVLIIAIVMLA